MNKIIITSIILIMAASPYTTLSFPAHEPCKYPSHPMNPHSTLLSTQADPCTETIETPHFIIHYHPSHSTFALKTADLAESTYTDAVSFMKYTPPQKIHITIYPSTLRFFSWESSFCNRAYSLSDTKSIEVFGWNPLDIKRTLSYETTQVLLCWLLRDTIYIRQVRRDHQWILSGIPTYYIQYLYHSQNDLMPIIIQHLEETNTFPTCLEDINLETYDRLTSSLAASIIEYMFHTYGEEKFHAFLSNLSTWNPSETVTQNIDEALQTAFGTTKEEFEKEWITYIKEKYPPEKPHPLPEQVTYPPGWKVPTSWHENTILFVSDTTENLDIFIMNTDGTNIQQLTTDESCDFDAKFSPTGQKIAFTSLRSGYANIYCLNLDGFTITQITAGKHMDYMGSWSPDGKKIAFTSERNGNYDIYCIDINTSHITQLTTFEGDDGWPVYSPDGTKIVFVSERGGSYDLYTMNPDGTNICQLTDTPEYENFPQYSPNGKKIAFISRRETGSELCIMNANGTELTSVATPPCCIVDPMASHRDKIIAYPVWSPNGNKLAYTAINQIFIYPVSKSHWWIPMVILVIAGCIFVWWIITKNSQKKQKQKQKQETE